MANIKLASLLKYEWTLEKEEDDIALPFSLRQIGDRLLCCTKEGVFSFNKDLGEGQPIYTPNAKPLGNYLHKAVILDVVLHKDTENKDIYVCGTQGGILYPDPKPTQKGEEKTQGGILYPDPKPTQKGEKKKPNQIDTGRTRESFHSVVVDGASIIACSNTKKDYQVHKYNLAQTNIKHNLTVGYKNPKSFPRIALYEKGFAVMNATSGWLRFLHKDFTRNGIVKGIVDEPHLCDADETGMLVAKFLTRKLELYIREKEEKEEKEEHNLRIYDIQLSGLSDVSPITAVLWGNELFIAGWKEKFEKGKILKFVKGKEIKENVKWKDTKKIDMDSKEDKDDETDEESDYDFDELKLDDTKHPI